MLSTYIDCTDTQRPLNFLWDQDVVMSNPPGTISEVKPNPRHLHCAAVCAADYALTEDYAHFAPHLRMLKQPPKFPNVNEYSYYNFKHRCDNKILYLSSITYCKCGLRGLYTQSQGLAGVTADSLDFQYPALQQTKQHWIWSCRGIKSIMRHLIRQI